MKHVGLRSDPKDIASQEQLGDFAIIYPNGGSEGSPANVSINTRYSLDNPFPGHHVLCVAEIQLGGVWGPPGWMYNSGGQGVLAARESGDDIIVQTGSSQVYNRANFAGGVHGGATAGTSAPCRVLVYKVKGAVA